jgi:ubiquinol-cytochrome c reductase cytochrome c1 subunit
LDKAPDLTNDLAALQNGAKLFVNHCLNCHGAESMRFNRLRDIGLNDEQIKNNLLFTSDKVGDPMVVAFDPKEAKQWLGAAPPDLSVIARSRASAAGSGADYLYTYLRSYYPDPTKATGWNNHAFPNVGMPHVLWQQQQQLSPAEFDRAMAELTSFLVYMAEPARQDRIRLGVLVLLFLGVFSVCAWRLNAAYWKDIRNDTH